MLLELSDVIAPIAAPMRSAIVDVRRWALSQGRRVDADLLALVLVGKTEWRHDPITLWTRIGVYENLYSDVWNWCTVHSVSMPAEHVPETLWLYLSYLSETRQFASGSDPLRELRRPLRCYGGLGADGLPAPLGARRVVCVCKVPYRRRQ
jgi:hypothetical protein